MAWQRWSVAWEQALYGDGGFFVSGSMPRHHFRTSAHVGDVLAGVVLSMLDEVDGLLGYPLRVQLVDVGAGGGELLSAIARLARPELLERLDLIGVDVAPRPPGLPDSVEWDSRTPMGIEGLVVANEWLDDVPCDVAEADSHGIWREVLVDPSSGEEKVAGQVEVEDAVWLSLWWPDHSEGSRAEIGRRRDAAWAATVHALDRGVAVGIDYGHVQGHRRPTLTGYRDGRQVQPVPDGSCDITAHVALDACASAGQTTGGEEALLVAQRDVLRAYGVHGRLPAPDLAGIDPATYAEALQRANQEAELRDPDGLGAFGWMVQRVGVGLPPRLRDVPQGRAGRGWRPA